MDFFDSFNFIKKCPLANIPNKNDLPKGERISRLDRAIYTMIVKINEETGEVDSDTSKNTKTQIWLEFGQVYYSKEYKDVTGYHDYDLDTGAFTYEEAIIKLAQNIKKKYYVNGEFRCPENEDIYKFYSK